MFFALAGLFELSATIPYLTDILRGRTRPALTTWGVWLLLALFTCVAAIFAGAYSSAVISGAVAVECLLIFLFSIRYKNFTFKKFDAICILGVIFGLCVWWFSKDPVEAMVIAVVIDAIGAFPTIRHALLKPKEETIWMFILSILANICALVAVSELKFANILVPVYLLLLNTILVLIIFLGSRTREAKPSVSFAPLSTLTHRYSARMRHHI